MADIQFIRLPQKDLRSGRVAVEAVFWFSPEDWDAAKDKILAAYDGETPNQERMRATILGMFERMQSPSLDLRPGIKMPPVEHLPPEEFRRIVKGG